MRKLVILVAAAVVACGSSSTCPSGETSCNGTCVNTRTDTQNCGACGRVCTAGQACSSAVCSGVSGTIGGTAFSPAEVIAVRAGPSSCMLANPGSPSQQISISVSALAISAASYTNVCADFASPFCTIHTSATNVTILFASLNPTGSAQVVPGTYTVSPIVTTTLPDPNQPGSLYVAFAESLHTDASCPPTAVPAVANGTLRLDQVSSSNVVGHVDVAFSDGGKLQGDFSAPVCSGVSPDICALAQAAGQCTGTRTCQ